MRRFEFHPEALAEYEAAIEHYQSIQSALGIRFVEAIEAAIASIVESPQRWPVLEQSIRRRLTRVFPYAILYSVEADHVLVLAVMHCHQHPEYWRLRSAGSEGP